MIENLRLITYLYVLLREQQHC